MVNVNGASYDYQMVRPLSGVKVAVRGRRAPSAPIVDVRNREQ
jgi:hypothetical protein